MSKIKEIDGVYVNLDNVNWIKAHQSTNGSFTLEFSYGVAKETYFGVRGYIYYKTEEKAKARIKQILEKQNSDDIEI